MKQNRLKKYIDKIYIMDIKQGNIEIIIKTTPKPEKYSINYESTKGDKIIMDKINEVGIK